MKNDFPLYLIHGKSSPKWSPFGLGVELEMEGMNFPDLSRLTTQWTAHSEGSLQGGVEYVFSQPYILRNAIYAIDDLFKIFSEVGTKIMPTYRASTHVHVNVEHLTLRQIANILVWWGIIESPALKFCGERRDGNLFCIPFKHSKNTIHSFFKFSSSCDFLFLKADRLKYSIVNIAPLRTLRSVEFRGMSDSDSPERIKKWVSFIDYICRKAANTEDISTIFYSISSGADLCSVCELLFGPLLPDILSLHDESFENIYSDIYSSVWNVQELAYLDISRPLPTIGVASSERNRRINWPRPDFDDEDEQDLEGDEQ